MYRLLNDNDQDRDGVELMAATREAEDRGERHTCEDRGEGECWFCGREL